MNQTKGLIFFLITALVVSIWSNTVSAKDSEEYAPTLSGISLNCGYTYNPADGIFFSQVTLFRLYDYEKIWMHKAPDYLRFKVEGSLGGALLDEEEVRAVANVNIMALMYLKSFETDTIKPYLEAGIGAIYTDYQVRGQDYRFNFNPQAGFGIEFKRKGKQNCFVSLRGHHISNGGIGSSNRSQDSIVFALGQYF